MTPSRVLAVLLISFILGTFFSLPGIMLGFLLLFCTYLLFRSPLLSVFCLLFFLCGVFRFTVLDGYVPPVPETPLQGTVISGSFTKGERSEVTVKTENGNILLYLDRHSVYNYGDVVLIEGTLKKVEDPLYANYLKKDRIYHTSYNPSLIIIEKGGFSVKSVAYNLKNTLKERMRTVMPAPQVFFLEAMITGDRGSLSASMNEKLSIAGVRHIVAVSGMHVVIVSSLVLLLFRFIGVSEKRSCFLSLLFIVGFVILVGAPASAVRAGVMGSLLVIARGLGVSARSARSVVFAAAVMLIFNPLLISYDVGFQLSFLAVLGIIYFFEPVNKTLTSVLKNEYLRNTTSVTVSALIATSPLILHNFGSIPLLSVFTNMAIIPLLPFIFVFGVLGAVTGWWFVSFPAYLMLSFTLFIVDAVSSFKFASLQIANVPFLLLLLFYICIFYRFKLRFFI